MAGRVTQESVEVLHPGAPAGRVTQVVVEALYPSDAPGASFTLASAGTSAVAWSAGAGLAGAGLAGAGLASGAVLGAAAGAASVAWSAGSTVAVPGLGGAELLSGSLLAVPSVSSEAGWLAGSVWEGDGLAAADLLGGALLLSEAVSADDIVGDVITAPTMLGAGAAVANWESGSLLVDFQGLSGSQILTSAIHLVALTAPSVCTLSLRAGSRVGVATLSVAEWRWVASAAGALRVSLYSRSRLYSVWYPRRGGSPVPICYVLLGYASSDLNTGRAGGERRLWVQLDRLIACEFDALELAPDGTSPAPPVGQVCTPGLPTAEYLVPLEFTLRAGLGPAGYAIHPHGYDWRLSCLVNGRALADRIRSESTPDEPCSLVCHSMGGLVARVAYADLARTGETGLVRRIVTIGTPHRGSYGVVVLFSDDFPLIQQMARIKQILLQATALLNPLGLVVPSPEGGIVRIAATWPATYELMPALDAQAQAADPNRALIYDPARWPLTRGVSAAWLAHARDVWGPALRAPAALPPAHVLTTVAGYGVPTPVRLDYPERLGRAEALGWSDDGDGLVSVDSALVEASARYVVPGAHPGLHLTPQVLGQLAAWVLDERAPESPAPSRVVLPGPMADTPVGPPLNVPPSPAGAANHLFGMDC